MLDYLKRSSLYTKVVTSVGAGAVESGLRVKFFLWA